MPNKGVEGGHWSGLKLKIKHFMETGSLKLPVVEVQLFCYESDICSIIEIFFLKRNILSVFFFGYVIHKSHL